MIGMKLIVLENIHKQLGVVNGSEVHLKDIHYDTSSVPIALEVLLPNGNFQVETLPPNCIWIQRKKTSQTFRKIDGSEIIIQRNQFPVTEGFAATAHKKQGSTLHRAVLKLEGGKGVSSYVKLSRTKRAADTFIMGSISLSNLTIKPPNGWNAFLDHLRNRMVSTLEKAENITSILD